MRLSGLRTQLSFKALRSSMESQTDSPVTEVTGDTEQLSQSRNDFYLKVSIVALLLLGVALCQAWILEFYFRQPVISNISFRGVDPSWLPPGVHIRPALGGHYFGDFEQYLGYAESHLSPYSSKLTYQAAYGPISVVFVKLFYDLFGWPGAVLVYLPLSVLLFLWGMARLLGDFLSARLLAVLLLFSAGILIGLDRGNFQLLVAALSVWFCVGLLENRPGIMIVSLALAVSVKLYVAVLLLVLIRQRRWRDTGLIIGVSGILYALCFALVGGGYISNIRDFIHTNFAFASSPSLGFMLSCVSAASVVYKFLFLSWGLNHFLSFLQDSPTWYIQVPGLVIAVACVAVIWLTKRPREYMLIAALALMQLGPASTYPYVEINTVIELALLMRVASRPPAPDTNDVPDGDPPVSRRMLLVCIALLLVASAPWLGLIYGALGSSTPMSWLISPICNIGVVVVLLVGLLLGVRRNQRARREVVALDAELGVTNGATGPDVAAT